MIKQLSSMTSTIWRWKMVSYFRAKSFICTIVKENWKNTRDYISYVMVDITSGAVCSVQWNINLIWQVLILVHVWSRFVKMLSVYFVFLRNAFGYWRMRLSCTIKRKLTMSSSHAASYIISCTITMDMSFKKTGVVGVSRWPVDLYNHIGPHRSRQRMCSSQRIGPRRRGTAPSSSSLQAKFSTGSSSPPSFLKRDRSRLWKNIETIKINVSSQIKTRNWGIRQPLWPLLAFRWFKTCMDKSRQIKTL